MSEHALTACVAHGNLAGLGGLQPEARCLWAAQGGAAEAVAAQLEGRLRAALKARGNPFTEGGPAAYGAAAATGRPLLALFDRTFELRCLQVSGSELPKSLPHHSVHCKLVSLSLNQTISHKRLFVVERGRDQVYHRHTDLRTIHGTVG